MALSADLLQVSFRDSPGFFIQLESISLQFLALLMVKYDFHINFNIQVLYLQFRSFISRQPILTILKNDLYQIAPLQHL